MAHRTTRRAGMYTETGRGSAVANVQQSKGISIVTKYKGLQDNKNDVVAVQDSLADVDNLYIDDNDLLSSRPPMKSFTPVHNVNIANTTSVRMWNIEGYVFRLLKGLSDNNVLYYIVCDNKIPVIGEDIVGEPYLTYDIFDDEKEPRVVFTPIESKIFIWITYTDDEGDEMNPDFWYFDIKTNRFIDIDGDSEETYIYQPIVHFIDNGVITKPEKLNAFNPLTWRDRYKYGLSSNIDFSILDVGDTSTEKAYYVNNNEQFIGQFDINSYPNKDIAPVLLYPRGLVTEPDYYDIVEHENSITIMCWYKEERLVKVSTDGKNYTTIQNMPIDTIIAENNYVGDEYEGHPFLSKDGSTVIAFTSTHIYFANVMSPIAENYMIFVEHNYFEGETGSTTFSIIDAPRVIAYFYNETIYAYILQFVGTVNGTTHINPTAKILCISHERSTQRVDVIDKSSSWTTDFVYSDNIMMCPRRMTKAEYVSGDGYYTPGPVYLMTYAGELQLHSIVYTNNTDDPDDINSIYQDYRKMNGSYDIFDHQDATSSNRDFTAFTLSNFPTYYYDNNGDEQADVYLAAIYRRTAGQPRRIEIRYGYLTEANDYTSGGSYTSIKRAHYEYTSMAGEIIDKVNVAISLQRVYFMLKRHNTSDNFEYIQKYYNLLDLPTANNYALVSAAIGNSVKSYAIAEILKEITVVLTSYDKTNNLWGIFEGSLWTTYLFTDTVIYIDLSYMLLPYPLFAPTHFATLQEYYFSFKRLITLNIDALDDELDSDNLLANPLAVTATRRNDKNEFLLYLPLDDVQECINEITNLCPISSQTMAVFLEDSIWYASMDTVDGELVHKKLTKSKISFGCKKGTDVLVTSDGQSIIFPTYRGIALLGPQDFVATTDPIIKYISDNIQNTYLRFYSETMRAIYQTYTDVDGVMQYGNTVKEVPFSISFVTYKYWIFMYKRNSREILLYDMRDNTWWTWTLQYPVIDLVVQDRLYALLNTPEYATNNYVGYEADGYDGLVPNQVIGRLFVAADKEADLGYVLENFPAIDPATDDFSYEDEVFPHTFKGDVRDVKDDTYDGSHIELSIAQSRIDWYLISQKLYLGALNNYKSITGINIVAKGLYEYGTKLTLKTYRNVLHPEESIDMNVFVKDLRTFVQRLNLMHTIFFQYKLSNTDDDKQRQAHIASLCVKYETKEGVR